MSAAPRRSRARGRAVDEPPPPAIAIVQVIDIQYSKRTRGGEGARRRAALPTTFPVPELRRDALHLIYAHQWHDFRAQERTEALLMPSAAAQIAHRLTVSRDADGALVIDDGHDTRALVIAHGWGRLRCNQLQGDHDHTWYRELIVNAAQVAPPATGNVFAGAPSVERDLRRPIERRRQPWPRR